MRFSVWPNLNQPWDALRQEVAHVEAAGWDGVYVADHFMGDGGGFGPVDQHTFEATAALAALAATTERLRLGSLVFGATYRHPAVLANWAATVDHVSGGRLVLGVGAGWQENEHDQYGIELPPPGERLRRFEEACRVLRGLLADERTTVEGSHHVVRDAVCEPKPVQDRLPLLIGGKGDRMLGIVARHADEWNMWSTPALMAQRSGVLERRCAEQGRDPATITRSTQALVFLVDDQAKADELVDLVSPRPAVGGPVERFVEMCEGWIHAGVDEVIVPDFTLGRGAERLEHLDEILAAVGPLRDR